VLGSLETKYKIPAHGLTLTEKWSTANVLNTTVDLQDKILPGLKLTLDTTYKPETNAFAGKLSIDHRTRQRCGSETTFS
jgi:voltage-dependent anion channel protein 2